ncbi:Myosin-2, partial [Smittium culicis]
MPEKTPIHTSLALKKKKSSTLTINEFNKSLESYLKGAEAWIYFSENEWILATLTNLAVDYDSDKISICFIRKIVPNEDIKSLLSKEKKLENLGIWSAEAAPEKDSVILTFKATIRDICKKRVELPYLRNPLILDGIDDLTNLSHLNEPSVVHDLKIRFLEKKIYTYSGVVLVSLNPFFPIDIYGEKTMLKYVGQNRNKNDPHLYAVAEDAFNGMSANMVSQSIIVYGESGAGKTTSAKHIMRYFAQARRNDSNDEMTTVEKQILATNPVFEAFGNAKTTRNDNSSRFGKYIEILFGDDKKSIVGAKTRTFLLERSRICNLPDTERNYHIFYQLLAGASKQTRDQCHLSDYDWNCFSYLNKGGCGEISGVNDSKEFISTCEALELVGIDDTKQGQIWKVLSSLLHIGNIPVKSDTNGNTVDSFDKCTSFQTASNILGLDQKVLRKCFLTKTITTTRDVIETSLKKSQTIVLRDSIAKFLYSRLFDWILGPLNSTLVTNSGNDELFVGILDIYGFEYFEINSFEQLCINYANEKLQQHFNNHVFHLEQEEYMNEKLTNWEFIGFHDNRPCIELIEGKLGILTLLDEESRLEASTDTTFVSKLYMNFLSEKNHKSSDRRQSHDPNSPLSFFEKPRFSNSSFTVLHYAHPVTYEGEGFLEKNKDSISDELMNLLKSSSFSFIQELVVCGEVPIDSPPQVPHSMANGGLVAPYINANRSKKQSPTLGAVFRRSLNKLMKKIALTELHYIRCIKTNTDKEPWKFESDLIVSQLRSCGVLETIKISKAGYPSRINIHEFNDRYRNLLPYETRSRLINNHTLTNGVIDKSSDNSENRNNTNSIESPKEPSPTDFSKINSRNSSVILFSKIDTISKERLSTISDSFNKSSSDLSKVEDGDRDLSKLILQSCIEDRTQYQVGLTKVFFRAGQWANLENMRAKLFNDSAEVIQKNYKKYLYRKKYIQTKDSALIIQKWWKQKSFELKVRRFKQKCASVKIFNFWKVQKEKQAERMRIIEENAKKLAESNANNNFPTNIPYRTSSLSAGVCLPYSSMMIPRSSSGLNIPGDNSRLSLIFRDRSIVSSEAKYSMISEINNSVISNQNNAPWEQVKTFCLENRNYRNRLESDQTDTETLVFPIINRKSCPDVSELTQTNNSDVNVFKRDAKNTRPRIYTLPLDSERLYSIIAYGDKMEAFRRGYSVSSESSLVQDRQIFDKLGYKSSQIGLNIEGQIGASNIQSRNVLLKNYTFGDFSTSENLNELGKINKVEKYGKPTNFHNINIANSNQKISNISNNISIVFENNNGMTRIPLTKNRVTNGYTHVGNNDKKYSGRNSFSSESLRKSFGTVDYQNMPSYKRSFDKSYESFFGPGEFNKQKSSSTIDHRIDTLISPKSIESFNAKVLKRIRERGLSKINPTRKGKRDRTESKKTKPWKLYANSKNLGQK